MPLTRMAGASLTMEELMKNSLVEATKPKPTALSHLAKIIPIVAKGKAAHAVFNLGKEDARIGPWGVFPGPTEIANNLAEHQVPYLPSTRPNPETDLGARAGRALNDLGVNLYDAIQKIPTF